MADEIRKIANLRTEASAPDLPGRVQNEEFVFDENKEIVLIDVEEE